MKFTDNDLKILVKMLASLDKLELLKEIRRKLETGECADSDMAILISLINRELSPQKQS